MVRSDAPHGEHGGDRQGYRDPWEARTRTDQSSLTEAVWNIPLRCRTKGKFRDVVFR